MYYSVFASRRPKPLTLLQSRSLPSAQRASSVGGAAGKRALAMTQSTKCLGSALHIRPSTKSTSCFGALSIPTPCGVATAVRRHRLKRSSIVHPVDDPSGDPTNRPAKGSMGDPKDGPAKDAPWDPMDIPLERPHTPSTVAAVPASDPAGVKQDPVPRDPSGMPDESPLLSPPPDGPTPPPSPPLPSALPDGAGSDIGDDGDTMPHNASLHSAPVRSCWQIASAQHRHEVGGGTRQGSVGGRRNAAPPGTTCRRGSCQRQGGGGRCDNDLRRVSSAAVSSVLEMNTVTKGGQLASRKVARTAVSTAVQSSIESMGKTRRAARREAIVQLQQVTRGG